MKVPLHTKMAQHSPSALARAYRVAAETARRDPYWSPSDGEVRAKQYEQEAVRIESRAKA
jgi:hypothetical protein